MDQVKDTLRALVRISYDGKVYKTFRGPKAQERFTCRAGQDVMIADNCRLHRLIPPWALHRFPLL